jgi:hypothetical protein
MTKCTARVWFGMLVAVFGTVIAGLGSAQAQTAKEVELEARIQRLEKIISELTGKPVPEVPETAAAPPPPPPTPQGPALQAQSITPNAQPGTRFSFTGFFKLDAIGSQYRDGDIADGNVGRDFYLPATIPIGGADEDIDLDAHVKSSRFIFGTDGNAADGGPIASRLEIDLFGTALGDERVTNAYGVLLRQAYVQYKNWLVGQAWSNFQDVVALPETADFIGPTDGTTFVRQPQVRYTRGNLSLSAENPETTITPFGGGARISSDDNDLPDLTAAYMYKLSNGYLRGALLARQLKLQSSGMTSIDDSSYVAALSVSGKINFGPNDLRFMFTGGDGFGRYVGVNFANDAELTPSGELRSVSGWAAFAAWRQVWRSQLRSTLMVSLSEYDNNVSLSGTMVNKSSFSLALNTIYTLAPKLDIGIELRYAEREIETGAEGALQRVQAFAKYAF